MFLSRNGSSSNVSDNSVGSPTNTVLDTIQAIRRTDHLINEYNQLHDHKLYSDDKSDKSDVDYRIFSSMILNIKVE